ncbi:MAG: hypothetical protein CBB71_18870 [Rhodopirellula sp. TMED11]|nr:MAG: hypothetical protein CBB71_18870 [Rhodopirellula sp. TMED11]
MFHRFLLPFVAGALLSMSVPATAADDLVASLADSPRYQLSNLRTETDRFGKSVIAIDYRRTKKGPGSVSVSGRSASGRTSVSAYLSTTQDSGTVRLSSLFGGRGTINDIEFYLVQNYRIDASKTVKVLVSNPVRLGNPGGSTGTRSLTAAEKAQHQEFVRIMNDDSAHKPNKEYKVTIKPPEGSDFVSNTVKLTKGTRLQACYQDSWHPLTAISENSDGTVNVRWDKYGPTYDCAMKRGELVIETSLVSRLSSHPTSRFPETVPNWASESAKTTSAPSADAKGRKSYPVSISVPQDSEFVSADLTVKAGVKLQACYAGKWNPITALSENKDGTLNVRWDEYGAGFDCSMLRSELIIKKTMAQQLKSNPDAVAESTPPLRRKNYTVAIPVPTDSALVPADAVLAPGTKLQACYAGKWNPITFLSHASDGTLNVQWDDYGQAYDCSMVRNELIVKKSVLRTLQSGSAAGQMRTFTDATGKFRVKAKVVQQTATEVTLLTEQGKEVTLPLTRLSEADQEFLKSSATTENPFQ